jgi:hypothetical protein
MEEAVLFFFRPWRIHTEEIKRENRLDGQMNRQADRQTDRHKLLTVYLPFGGRV